MKIKNKKEISSKESIKAQSNTMTRNHKRDLALWIGMPIVKIIIKLPKFISVTIKLIKIIKSSIKI
jgi:hypothetical protein